MKDAGADQYTFHIEATDDPALVCRKIKEAGMKVGIGIKPKTDVKVVDELVDMADMILVRFGNHAKTTLRFDSDAIFRS